MGLFYMDAAVTLGMETKHFDPTLFLPTALTEFVVCSVNHAHGGFVLTDYCDLHQNGT